MEFLGPILCGIYGIGFFSNVFSQLFPPVYNISYAFEIWSTGLGFFLIAVQISIRSNQIFVEQRDETKIFVIKCIHAFIGLLFLIGSVLLFLALKYQAAIWMLISFVLSIYIVWFMDFVLKESFFKEQSGKENNNCCICGYYVNDVLVFMAIIALAMILNGAVINSNYIQKYPNRGSFVTVTLNSGKTQKLAYYCEGEATLSPYTFITEASNSHGQLDFYPLLREMTKVGLRVCVFDKQGLGHSDNFFSDQNPTNVTEWYGQFLDGLKEETKPFIFIGWGGGGGIALEIAKHLPSYVQSIVLLDNYGENIEWRSALGSPYNDYNTKEEVEIYRKNSLPSRYFLFNIIQGVGCPFGFMSIFLGGSDGYNSTEFYEEYALNYQIEKSWTTQRLFLNDQINNPIPINDDYLYPGDSVYENSNLITGKPILAMYTNKTIDCSQFFDNSYWKEPQKECDSRQWSNDFLANEALLVSNVTGNAVSEQCTDKDCSLGFPLRFPLKVTNAIVKHIALLNS